MRFPAYLTQNAISKVTPRTIPCLLFITRTLRYIAQTFTKYPELFPTELEGGFWFDDFVFSTKQQLPIRRIKLKENSEVYQIRPDFRNALYGGKNRRNREANVLKTRGVCHLTQSLTFSVVMQCSGIAFIFL